MAILTKHEIKEALKLLGELAEQQGDHIELLLIGGAIMVLAYDERQSTQDVDVLILFPREVHRIRELIKQVASKRNLPEDWLNDGAMGYLVGLSQGPVIYSAPGIIVRSPAVAQLLTMKLSAWRDDVDIADARRLLQELPGGQDQVWESVEPYLVPGDELKAQYAFWIYGRLSVVQIEQLAKAVLNGEGLLARSLTQDFFRENPRLVDIVKPAVEDMRILAVSASLIELFALRMKQDAPAWTRDIGPLVEPIYLVGAVASMKRLRTLCETESPEPLRKRGFYAPPNYPEFA